MRWLQTDGRGFSLVRQGAAGLTVYRGVYAGAMTASEVASYELGNGLTAFISYSLARGFAVVVRDLNDRAFSLPGSRTKRKSGASSATTWLDPPSGGRWSDPHLLEERLWRQDDEARRRDGDMDGQPVQRCGRHRCPQLGRVR